jgi:hypothetical protein
MKFTNRINLYSYTIEPPHHLMNPAARVHDALRVRAL